MSSEIRLRRHTDGRVALCFESDQYHWRIFQRSAVSGRVGFAGSELGPQLGAAGWSELLVAELPKPDGHRPGDNAPFWALSFGSQQLTAYPDGLSVMYADGYDVAYAHYRTEQELGELRDDGLRVLAAASAYKRYRQEIHG